MPQSTATKYSFVRDHLIEKALIKPDTSDEYLIYNRNIIINVLSKIFFIEECLPFLNFTLLLNKQQIMTQNLKKTPNILRMNTLCLLSEPKLGAAHRELHKLSGELWSMLVSCNIRQKQFRDFFLSGFPVTYFYKNSSTSFASKFNFALEFIFNHVNSGEHNIFNQKRWTSETSTSDNSLGYSVYNLAVDLKNLDGFYEALKNEWISMCQVYRLMKELNEAANKYPDIIHKLDIKCVNFKKLVISYGPSLLYKIQFEWSKEHKRFELSLGVNHHNKLVNSGQVKNNLNQLELNNPHLLFINEVKKYFAKTQSVINLIRVLNTTFVFAYALNKLVNIPKINAKIVINQMYAAFSSFMVIVYAMNHVRLIYHAKYWVDIQLKQNGQLTFRDSCFDYMETKKDTEQANILRFLNVSVGFSS